MWYNMNNKITVSRRISYEKNKNRMYDRSGFFG